MRIHLDENLSNAIAEILREGGVDAVTTHEVGNIQFDDRAQLVYAAREGRAIVTANIGERAFPKLGVERRGAPSSV